MLLIYPPHAKNCEMPAGIALLAATLRAHGQPCLCCDCNREGQEYLLASAPAASDTWSRRAWHRRDDNMQQLRSPAGYASFSRYQRAVSDLNRLLAMRGKDHGLSLSLANYADPKLSPVASSDLLQAAENFRGNIYYPYFSQRLPELLTASGITVVGFSINYLSQALTAMAMLGFLRQHFPELTLIAGGGLITTWISNPGWREPFAGLIDHCLAGPAESPLLQLLGGQPSSNHLSPDYQDLDSRSYLAPGCILPFAASRGCYWRQCSFCPETSEQSRFQQLPVSLASQQLRELASIYHPVLIHFLDNALPPGLLNHLLQEAPLAPWYGFARFSEQLADPDFCQALAASGCRMLKLGLESGSQPVLDALGKGITLPVASRALHALHQAGIATYVYLLFGTPAETVDDARLTLQFVEKHQQAISYINTAIFNLPVNSSEAPALVSGNFYRSDLSIYHEFVHPQGWHRPAVRQFLDREFGRNPAVTAILKRDPLFFTSNHAAFFTPAAVTSRQ